MYFLASAAACIALVSAVAARPFRKGTFTSRVDQAQESQTLPLVARIYMVPFRVEDKRGNEVPRLTAPQFHVLEDGKPRDILYFDGPAEPGKTTIVFLIDWSGSMIECPPRAELQSAAEMLGAMVDRGHCVLPAKFSDRVTLLGDNPCDAAEVKRDISSAATSRRWGPTALNDAISWAATELTFHSGYHAIVIVSDGADNHSRGDQEEAIRRVIKANAQVFFVRSLRELGTFEPHVETDISDFTKKITEKTGGDFVSATSASEYHDAFVRIANDLHSVYTIGFSPDSADKPNTIHKIQVKLSQKGLRIVAPQAFYVPKPTDSQTARPPS